VAPLAFWGPRDDEGVANLQNDGMEEQKRRNYHGVGLHPLFASSICEIRMLLMIADDDNNKKKRSNIWSSHDRRAILVFVQDSPVRWAGPRKKPEGGPGRRLAAKEAAKSAQTTEPVVSSCPALQPHSTLPSSCSIHPSTPCLTAKHRRSTAGNRFSPDKSQPRILLPVRPRSRPRRIRPPPPRTLSDSIPRPPESRRIVSR
jgi:hypothetical protein